MARLVIKTIATRTWTVHCGVDASSLQLTTDAIGERVITPTLGCHPLLELVCRSRERCRLILFKLAPVAHAIVAQATRAWRTEVDARVLQLTIDPIG